MLQNMRLAWFVIGAVAGILVLAVVGFEGAALADFVLFPLLGGAVVTLLFAVLRK